MEKPQSLFSVMTNRKPQPIEPPPDELVSYRNSTQYAKDKAIDAGFFQQQFIEAYLDKKWKAELYNRDTLIWLCTIYKEEVDHEKLDKIRKKADEFKSFINRYNHPYRALIFDYRKYGIWQIT